MFVLYAVVRAYVPKLNLDALFEQKGEVAKAVSEELEKVLLSIICFTTGNGLLFF